VVEARRWVTGPRLAQSMLRWARLSWKAVVPHSDGVAESRIGLRPKHRGEDDHGPLAGIDVHWNAPACAVVDTNGKIVRGQVASEPRR